MILTLLRVAAVVKTFGFTCKSTLFTQGREPTSNPVYVATVAILAQGTSRAVAVTQAFFVEWLATAQR